MFWLITVRYYSQYCNSKFDIIFIFDSCFAFKKLKIHVVLNIFLNKVIVTGF